MFTNIKPVTWWSCKDGLLSCIREMETKGLQLIFESAKKATDQIKFEADFEESENGNV